MLVSSCVKLRALLSLTLLSVGTVIANDLVMVTDEQSRSVLQTTIALQTNNEWNVSAYAGSDVQMVDDIRERAVKSTLPSAAQIPGATIQRWAALGFINDLSDTSFGGSWESRLPKSIQQDISFRGFTYAVPTQIYRSNWMWMNQRTNAKDGGLLSAPRTWQSFFELLENQVGPNSINILAVDDPAQNTLILEALILGLQGPEFYKRAFSDLDYQVLKSDEMITVFQRLGQLRPYLRQPVYQTWQDASAVLLERNGSVLFAGDWIKPMLSESDGTLAEHISCEPYPEGSATFLYNLNSVVMFKQTEQASSGQLARLLFTESLLTDLNIREGSIPPRLDISPWGFDRCGVRAMREFRSAHAISTLVPSLAAGMVAPELVQKSVYDVVNEFVESTTMNAEEGAKALAKAIKLALYRM